MEALRYSTWDAVMQSNYVTKVFYFYPELCEVVTWQTISQAIHDSTFTISMLYGISTSPNPTLSPTLTQP